jgi:hypothetical protein
VSQHHNQRCVALNKRAFHEAVLNEISKIFIYVQAHIHGRKRYAQSRFDFGGSNHNVLVYRYASIFAGETVDANDVAVLVLAVCGPRYGAGGSFGDDFNYVACAYAQFLHGPLVYAGDSASDVALSGVACA